MSVWSNFKPLWKHTDMATDISLHPPHQCVCGLLALKSLRAYGRTSSSRRWCNFPATIILSCTKTSCAHWLFQTSAGRFWRALRQELKRIKDKKTQGNRFLRRVNPFLKSHVHTHTTLRTLPTQLEVSDCDRLLEFITAFHYTPMRPRDEKGQSIQSVSAASNLCSLCQRRYL